MSGLAGLFYPRLRGLPAGEREAALRTARASPFDVIELVGIAVGLIVVTLLTRYSAEQWSGIERASGALFNFAVAIPLLALFVGPFLVRRTRRALDAHLESRSRP